MCKIVMFMAAALALISGQALAQDAPVQYLCAAATSMDWNNTALFGTWRELARNPIGNTKACMEFSVGLMHDNKTLSINMTHSSTSTSLYANTLEHANVTLVPNATTGYNVSFVGDNSPTTFIKLLQYINETYIVGCGYTNATDDTTSYGFILAHGSYNDTTLKIANNDAAKKYTNFKVDTYGNITQAGCYKSSAGQTLPVISGFLALALLLIKAH